MEEIHQKIEANLDFFCESMKLEKIKSQLPPCLKEKLKFKEVSIVSFYF
jgi:hypothetical protein